MGREPGEHVIGVLPDRLGHHQRHARLDAREHVEPLAGAGDEAVASRPGRSMAPLERPAGPGERRDEVSLHGFLGRPANAVGLLAEVAAGNENCPAAALLHGR